MNPDPESSTHPMTHLPTLRRSLVVALVVGLALSGCAAKAKTGSGVHTTNSGNANLNLGGPPTATRKPTPVRTKPPVVHTQPPVVRTATPAQTVRPTQAPIKAFQIAINGDTSGKRTLDPPDVSVYSGTPITWTNRDTQPRSVVAVNGAFHSPLIPPGKTFTWTPAAGGKYDYSDGTRPYVNGQIQVTPR